MRLLDCGATVVTAAVSEAAFNKLQIGGAARFKPRGADMEHTGRIIGLTGLAAAPSNFAIAPSALDREPYRATISVPTLAEAQDCNVGRTGVVTFSAAGGSISWTNAEPLIGIPQP